MMRIIKDTNLQYRVGMGKGNTSYIYRPSLYASTILLWTPHQFLLTKLRKLFTLIPRKSPALPPHLRARFTDRKRVKIVFMVQIRQ